MQLAFHGGGDLTLTIDTGQAFMGGWPVAGLRLRTGLSRNSMPIKMPSIVGVSFDLRDEDSWRRTWLRRELPESAAGNGWMRVLG